MSKEKYNHKKIERKWQAVWRKKGIYETNLKNSKKPFYNLTMFPYPSASGLHAGNMYDMVGCDVYGRMKRMQGYEVFQPIGLDGFGIHSENYAIKINKHPMKLAKITEKHYYEQIQKTGCGFNWKTRLETYDPEYYKWTQWIFLEMFKRGLAYRKNAPVNWCPSCKTVLADEQVISGKCERCETEVIKKDLEQWFFRITDYAGRLLKDLDKIDWSESVKTAQRNWIGESLGAALKFSISNSQLSIDVFTTRPDTIFGATYLVLAPEHEIISNLKSQILNLEEIEKYVKAAKKNPDSQIKDLEKDKTGIELKGIKAINPANGEKIPVWISDYVLKEYGTGAIMAVPAHDQRDFDFAKKFNLPIKMVVCPNYPEPVCPIMKEAFEGSGHLVDSGDFTGMPFEEAKEKITKFLGGEVRKIYKLRDWLISRQRYWGPPIPLIFCDSCRKKLMENSKFGKKFNKGEIENPGWIAVSEKDLPVKLPFIKNFRPTGTDKSPLAGVKKFYEIKCPKCGSKSRRETDVSDTFLDSSWYFFRYLDLENKKEIFSKSLAKKWLPVERYMGGFEHAVLHLLYTRFVTKVFYDWKLISFNEPFKKFRAHGHITKDGFKMSKSKGNVVNPDDYIKNFGSDTFRAYLMFLAPYEQGGDFRDEGIRGIVRFLERVWRLGQDIMSENSKRQPKKPQNSDSEKLLHQSVKKITEDIENLHYNTAISQLMVFLNTLETAEGAKKEYKEYYEIFLKLLSPFAPHITEELWQKLGNKPSVHNEFWPKYDAKKITEETFELIAQINGKKRDQFQVSKNISEEEAKNLTLNRGKIKKHLDGRKIEKIIYVPDKIINIVAM